ncbi:MAG: cob(I)yrinic acid a,c-diamide adenosyltransferase [Candidatus Caldatribacteriaceae bacterium]
MSQKGMIQVYYGDGKGKTTASLGLLLRAVGYNFRVLFVQFFKGAFSGEIASLQYLPGVTMYRFGSKDFLSENYLTMEQKQEFLCGWYLVKEALRGQEYDLIILDELPYAFNFHLLSWEDFQKTMEERNPCIEVVITGRKVPEELVRLADLVSEVRNVKHPFQKGASARKGVEY